MKNKRKKPSRHMPAVDRVARSKRPSAAYRFKWITHDGKEFSPKKMSTSHVYCCIRMMYNNVMPPALRVDTDNGSFRRWGDIKCWSPAYLERATYELTRELQRRLDYEHIYKDYIDDMAFNAELWQRMNRGTIIGIHLP